MFKHKIRELLAAALEELVQECAVSADSMPDEIPVETPRREGHGDYASGIALALARSTKTQPRQLAEQIRERIRTTEFIRKIDIAGAGFINFHFSDQAYGELLEEILAKGDAFGTSNVGCGEKVLVEFVSANPTGPLHIGHGRGAAYGDSLARLLRAAGYEVDTEYYVNDIGRQMNILTVSTWLRYLELYSHQLEFPNGAYQGQYIVAMAQALMHEQGDALDRDSSTLMDNLPESKENLLDELVTRSIGLLGEASFDMLHGYVLKKMVASISSDLELLDVRFDRWFYESEVEKSGETYSAIEHLRKDGHLYESQGATWFRSSEFGDEKDRVVMRSNGQFTYFATDIAYHFNKFNRGYNMMINVWGADHHGYIARMKAVLEAAGFDARQLRIQMVQFAVLFQHQEKIKMSTRAGKFVELGALVKEIGADPARFFYNLRKSEQHLEFDIDLAKSKSSDNPVYYVQYAHARIASVFRQVKERSIERTKRSDHSLLNKESELKLMKQMARFPEVVESAALACEPHQLAYYLRELANEFHSFYNRERIINSTAAVREARLDLIDAVRQVLTNGLGLLGVSAPDTM